MIKHGHLYFYFWGVSYKGDGSSQNLQLRRELLLIERQHILQLVYLLGDVGDP